MLLSTVPMREILRNWKGVFDKAKKSNKPLIIISNNEPQAALVSLDWLEQKGLEIAKLEALEDVKNKKTKIIDSPEKLEEDLKDLEKYVND